MITEDLLQKLNLIIKPLFFQEKLSLVKCHQKKPQMTCMSVKARECHLVPVRKFGEQQDKVHLCSQKLIFPNSLMLLHTSHFQNIRVSNVFNCIFFSQIGLQMCRIMAVGKTHSCHVMSSLCGLVCVPREQTPWWRIFVDEESLNSLFCEARALWMW